MILWDQELHAATHTQYVPNLRERRFARWLNEWRDTGLGIAELTGWYEEAMDRQLKPDPVVNGFLTHLNDRQVPWGIVTNGPSQMQRHKCQVLGLDQIASFIIVSEEVGYAKPDLRIFRDALDATGLDQPERVMFIGDNPRTDIDGAKSAGMRTAWVRRGQQFPADLHPPDHVIDSVLEVQQVLAIEISE